MMQSYTRPSNMLLTLSIVSVALSLLILIQQFTLVFQPTAELSSFTIVTGAIANGSPVLLEDLPVGFGTLFVVPLLLGVLVSGLALVKVIRGYKANVPQKITGFKSGSNLFLSAFIVELVLSSIVAFIILWQVDFSKLNTLGPGPSGVGVLPYASLLYLVSAIVLRFYGRRIAFRTQRVSS